MGADVHDADTDDSVIKRLEARRDRQRAIQDARNAHIREASGDKDDTRRIVAFMYVLVRDHIPPGVLEEILMNHVLVHEGEDIEFTNGWLLEYVKDVVANVLARPMPLIPLPGELEG